MSSGRQTEIDWTRASQLRVLQECVLPDGRARDGKVVRAMALKSVLLAIDGFSCGKGECFARVQQISARANCSERHCKRALELLEEMSLIIRQLRMSPLRVVVYHYRIVWSEVALLAARRVDQSALAQNRSAPGPDRSAPGPDRSAPGAAPTETEGNTKGNNPDPDPDSEADPKVNFERSATVDEPAIEQPTRQQAPTREPVDYDRLPELREARLRTVAPLAPGRLIYGVFAPLAERSLGEPRTLIEWFRRQLSVADPVCEPTEADLLLVLAAARYALQIPAAQVRRNRVAVFISTVHRRRYLPVYRYVPAAADLLDDETLRALIDRVEQSAET